MTSFDIFLSYRHEHAERVASLARDLERRGLKVFLDRTGIRDFQPISEEIRRCIVSSATFLAWYSDDYLGSTACTLELARALAAHAAAPESRILIVSPTPSTDHVAPIWLKKYLFHTAPYGAVDWIATLSDRIVQHISGISRAETPSKVRDPHDFGQVPAKLFESLIAARHRELFGIFDALHMMEAPDATGRLGALPVLLSGPQGIGKSHCVQSYVSLFRSKYPGGIFWFDAGDASSETEASDALADQTFGVILELQASSSDPTFRISSFEGGLDIDRLRQTVRSHLASRGTYLWIVENLPESMFGQVDRWQAPSSNGRSIGTGAAAPDFEQARSISLRALRIDEVEQVLRMACGQGADRRVVASLAQLTEGYVGRLRRVQADIANFGLQNTCARYEADGTTALGIPQAYGPPIGACNENERSLIAALAAMGPTNIPYSAVEAMIGCLPTTDRSIPDLSLFPALDRLSALGLVSLSPASGVKVEAPVRRLARERPDMLPTASVSSVATLGLVQVLPADVRARPTPELASLISHARSLVRSVGSPEAALLLQRIGTFQALIGDRAGEKDFFQRSYEWFRDSFGPGDRRTVEARLELLTCYRHERSEKHLVEQALEETRRFLGDGDEMTILLMHRLSMVCGDVGEVWQALEISERAEEIALSVLGRECITTLRVQTSKALFLDHLGRSVEACELLRAVDAILTARRGSEDPDTLRVRSNLAALLGRSDPEKAWSFFQEILLSYHRSYGADHHLTAWAAYNLISCAGRSRWQEARRCVLRYFARQLASRRSGSLPRDMALRENDIHKECKAKLVGLHNESLKNYILYHRGFFSRRRIPSDWYEFALTIEYLKSGADTLAFEYLLLDYLRADGLKSKFARRMVARWKGEHTSSSPFRPLLNEKHIKEIERLIRTIGRMEWRYSPLLDKCGSLVHRRKHPALAWKRDVFR